MNRPDPEEWLSVAEAATLAGVTPKTIYAWLGKTGLIRKRVKDGKKKSCVRLIDLQLAVSAKKSGGLDVPSVNALSDEVHILKIAQNQVASALRAIAKALGITVHIPDV
jgi:hypothetical protein